MTEVNQDVMEQLKLEVGTDEEGNLNESGEKLRALQMKYGLAPVKLTPSEKYLIQKEERKNVRSA